MKLSDAIIERVSASIKGKFPVRMYRYWDKGQWVYGCSVSTCCDVIVPKELQHYFKKTSYAAQEKRRVQTAGQGSDLHIIPDKHAKGEKVVTSGEVLQWAKEWEATQTKYEMVAEASEQLVFSKTFGYGGQADRIGVFNCECPRCKGKLPKSKRALIDFKTGRYSHINLWKTEAYRRAYIEMTGDHDIGAVVLHIPRPELMEQGHKVQHYTIERHDTCFLNFLSAYQCFRMLYYRELIEAGMKEEDVYMSGPFVLHEMIMASELVNGLAEREANSA